MKHEQIAAMQEGIDRAIAHADRVHNIDWSEIALSHLRTFLLNHTGSFTCEDVRRFAQENECPTAPDPRAWGGVMRKAANEKWIAKVGISYAGAHGRYATLWVQE